MGIITFIFITCLIISISFLLFKLNNYFGWDIFYKNYGLLSFNDIINDDTNKSYFNKEMEEEFNIFKNICNKTNEKLIHYYRVSSIRKMYFCYNGSNKIFLLYQLSHYIVKDKTIHFINENMDVLSRKECAIDNDDFEYLLTQNAIKTNIINKTEIVSKLIKQEKENLKNNFNINDSENYYK